MAGEGLQPEQVFAQTRPEYEWDIKERIGARGEPSIPACLVQGAIKQPLPPCRCCWGCCCCSDACGWHTRTSMPVQPPRPRPSHAARCQQWLTSAAHGMGRCQPRCRCSHKCARARAPMRARMQGPGYLPMGAGRAPFGGTQRQCVIQHAWWLVHWVTYPYPRQGRGGAANPPLAIPLTRSCAAVRAPKPLPLVEGPPADYTPAMHTPLLCTPVQHWCTASWGSLPTRTRAHSTRRQRQLCRGLCGLPA